MNMSKSALYHLKKRVSFAAGRWRGGIVELRLDHETFQSKRRGNDSTLFNIVTFKF